MNYLPTWPLDITPHIAFGLMLIIGSIGGYAAHKISWLPSITGFMLVGFLAGPNGLGLLNHHMISEARILIDIALALILYRLGLSLDLKLLWRSPGLIFASLLESLATFGVVFYLLTLFEIPTVLSVLIAAISISSSPAVLLHVAHEVGAKGVSTETAKTLVALNNLISFVAFSAALSMLLFSSGFNWSTVFFQPLYTLLGSTVLGILLGMSLHAIAQRTHSATQYKLALVIGTIMVAIGLANQLKLSMLFCALVIGIVVKSIERESMVSDIQFGPSFELFFIVLFVFAGAGLHMKELLDFAPLVLALVLARSLAKVLGVAGITALYRRPLRKGIASGMLLIPMAGLAIGLALTASNMFPQHAAMISAIVLGAVAVFETMGPPIATFAFRYAGEDNEAKDAELKTKTANKSSPAKKEAAAVNPMPAADAQKSSAVAQDTKVAQPTPQQTPSSNSVARPQTIPQAAPEPEVSIGLVPPTAVVTNKSAAAAKVADVAEDNALELDEHLLASAETDAPEKPINQLFHEEHERPDDEEGAAEQIESPAVAPVAENTDTQNPASKTPAAEADNQGVDLVDRALNALAQTPADRMDVIAPAPVVAADEKIEDEVITAERPQSFWHQVAHKARRLFGLLGKDKNKEDA